MIATFALAFGLGLLSTFHCVAMCGGLVTALALKQPSGAVNRWQRALTYHLGRVFSYSLAGALAGGLAGEAGGLLGPKIGHPTLQVLAGVVVIGSGLAVLGRLPGLSVLQRAGLAFWRRLQPLGFNLLPSPRLTDAFVVGMIWGWLPCGLVYSMLAVSVAQAAVWPGLLVMLGFGLGTVPGLLALSLGLGRLQRLQGARHLRDLGGVLLIAYGIALIYHGLPLHLTGGHVH
jgi:uncharacterized protein